MLVFIETANLEHLSSAAFLIRGVRVLVFLQVHLQALLWKLELVCILGVNVPLAKLVSTVHADLVLFQVATILLAMEEF